MSQNKEETKKTRRFTTAQIAELVDYILTWLLEDLVVRWATPQCIANGRHWARSLKNMGHLNV
uniref:Transposase n=1 Tax=Timema bartmani TaxID=61472 RepID=A0A7R9FE62_9NEOP|nr:unnamed protein product [Timema bartmani]